MTVRAWLGSRHPAPPPALAARLDVLLGASGDASAARCHEVLLEASERVLRDVVAYPGSGRDCALDLLAADAFATYAFEAGAERPDLLASRAREAMRRLASTGVPR